MRIAKLDKFKALQNKDVLKEMYYQNAVSCAFINSFSYYDAEKKINEMIDHIANNTAICYGLFDNDLLVGYIWAYKNRFREENRIYVSEIRVIEKYRGKGYGKELIFCVEKEAREQKITAMYIHAEASNEEALRLYNKLGYEPERIQLRKGLYEDKK